MQLWTEYEGRKIAETYTLGKLLRSEGRNGFFSTADTSGHSAVIRLTEAHYDEDELLKRWQQVAEMRQSDLIGIERFGQTDFEGIAITYALMEANDANLAEVLQERPLTVTETTQVARAVHSALTALHARGLIHEHIEPVNVLAVGEAVKLRSDCVRECIADIEFNTPEGCAELRRRDVRDFGVLLLQCLTLEKRYNPGLNLPDIFRRLIPHMLDGTWSLEQVGQLVNPPVPAANPVPAASTASARPAKPQPEAVNASKAAKSKQPEQGTLPLDASSSGSTAEPRLRNRRELVEEPRGFNVRAVLLGGVAVLIVCVMVIRHFVSAKPAAPSTVTAPSAQVTPARVAPVATEQPSPRPIARSTTAAPVTAAVHAPGWYVIAWTYNHQSQAQSKAERMNAHFKGFHAEVFSPRGGTYLISLGGPMSEPQAKELQQRARHSGLPRDTYIRNYR